MQTKSTLDQWRILESIVREGGFERAARKLHMSQSSVSYAMSRLEDALGLPVLELQGRSAQLTPAGQELLQEVRPLLKGFAVLESQAGLLAKGRPTELHLAADSAFPDDLLFPALRRFQQRHKSLRFTLRQAIRLSPKVAFDGHKADLCIASLGSSEHISEALFDVELIAVAAVGHPLLKLGHRLSRAHLAEHVMVRIADSDAEAPLPTLIEGGQTWTVNTLPAALAAVLHGGCFAWLPRAMAEPELEKGRLRRLQLLSGARRVSHLFVSVRNDVPANSPAYDLLSELRHAVQGLHLGPK